MGSKVTTASLWLRNINPPLEKDLGFSPSLLRLESGLQTPKQTNKSNFHDVNIISLLSFVLFRIHTSMALDMGKD